MVEKDLLGGRYRVRERIGTGGMAFVYKAEDEVLHREVAVKILREEFLRDEAFVKRFRQEALAAARLSHPNIVGVYDVGETKDGYYIVMELVTGRTLKECIADGPMPLPSVAAITIGILRALVAAHRAGIVHRDIKPQNILITQEGRVKVADFGIARAATDGTLVHTTTIMGSAHYLSPEQARGSFVDEKSDLYSLGVVLFEMITGKPPFEGANTIAVALRHVQEVPPALRKLRPDTPRKLESVVHKLLAKDPAQRYYSAEACLADLLTVQRDLGGATEEGIMAEIAGSSDRRRRGRNVPRKPQRLWLALSGLLALLLAATAYGYQRYTNVPEETVPKVVGRSTSAAEHALRGRGLVPHVGSYQHSAKPSGTVLAERPTAGSTVKKGRKVDLTVSSGPIRVSVPDVIRDTASNASAYLQGLGYHVRIERVSSQQTVGTVISQSPPSGHRVAPDTTITLQVSSGLAKPALVPNLVGSQLSQATKLLNNEGMAVGTLNYAYSSAPTDTVLEQSPASGSKAQNGQTATLLLSQGPPPSGGSGSTSTQTITVQLTASQPQELKVVVVDASGITTAYDQVTNPNTPVSLNLSWAGQGRLEEYVSGQLILSTPLPYSPPGGGA